MSVFVVIDSKRWEIYRMIDSNSRWYYDLSLFVTRGATLSFLSVFYLFVAVPCTFAKRKQVRLVFVRGRCLLPLGSLRLVCAAFTEQGQHALVFTLLIIFYLSSAMEWSAARRST